MVEVFKTDVVDADHATMLVRMITTCFGYKASFDLEDCDRILRVEAHNIAIEALTSLLKTSGCCAAVLPDEAIPVKVTDQ